MIKQSIRPLLTFLLLTLALLNIASCSKKPTDFTYSLYTKNNVQILSQGYFDEFNGRWLIINYWATWCHPCIKEIPELNKLNREGNISVIGINFDKPNHTELAEQQIALNIRFAVSTDAFDHHYGFIYPKSLPTTMIINPEGQLQEILLGPQHYDTLKAKINAFEIANSTRSISDH